MGADATLGAGEERTPGYLALPAEGAPAVLVVSDERALPPFVRSRCDDLAEAGFVAFAPDLAAVGREEGDEDGELDRLAVTASALRSHPGVQPPRCGAIGWAEGGLLALRLATTAVLDAVVSYEAVLSAEQAARITCPVLGLFAEVDDGDAGETESFFRTLRAAGVRAEDVTYPGTVQGFADPGQPSFAPLAAERSWARSVNFLRQHLYPAPTLG